MISIHIGNIYSYIEEASPSELAHIDDTLAVITPGCHFVPTYQTGLWDGKTRFLKRGKKSIKFPTGLLDLVTDCLSEMEKEYTIVDTRTKIGHTIGDSIQLNHSELGHITLRDYQYDSVVSALECSRGVVNVATNGGKCIPKDTLLLTPHGYKSLESIFQENGTPCRITEGVSTAHKVELINMYGKVEKASHVTFNGVRPLRKITTHTGLCQKATYNHPILTLSTEDELEWVKMEYLKKGDIVVTYMGPHAHCNEEDIEGAYKIGATNTHKVPDEIMTSSIWSQASYISGYVEHRMKIGSDLIEITVTSEDICHKIPLMLRNMGITAMSINRYPTIKKLYIYHDSYPYFLNIISMRSIEKRREVNKATRLYLERQWEKEEEKDNPEAFSLRNLVGTFKDFYKSLTNPRTSEKGKMKRHPNMYFERIAYLEDCSPEPTFDVHMPETHSFIANGIINHNTEIGCGIMQCIEKHIPEGKNILFLTHSKEIFTQSHARIQERLGMRVGRLGNGKWEESKIMVAMIPTLTRRLKDPKKKKEIQQLLHNTVAFIGDEVHHASSDSWYNLFMEMKNAYYRFGLTGTIDNKNKINEYRLYGSTGTIVSKVSNEFLIKEGYSAKPTIFLISLKGISNVDSWDYMGIRRQGIILNDFRNNKFAELIVNRVNSGKQCLVIVNETEHGEEILDILSRVEGLNVKLSHGDKTTAYREKVLKELKSKELSVLIATSILDEGVDVSGINCVFLMAGGKSTRQLLQRIGRGLRKKEDGSGLEVYDALDYHNEYLASHLLERYNVYKAEGFQIVKI